MQRSTGPTLPPADLEGTASPSQLHRHSAWAVAVRAISQENKKATSKVAFRAAQPNCPFVARGATPSIRMYYRSQPTLSARHAADRGANHVHGAGRKLNAHLT